MPTTVNKWRADALHGGRLSGRPHACVRRDLRVEDRRHERRARLRSCREVDPLHVDVRAIGEGDPRVGVGDLHDHGRPCGGRECVDELPDRRDRRLVAGDARYVVASTVDGVSATWARTPPPDHPAGQRQPTPTTVPFRGGRRRRRARRSGVVTQRRQRADHRPPTVAVDRRRCRSTRGSRAQPRARPG